MKKLILISIIVILPCLTWAQEQPTKQEQLANIDARLNQLQGKSQSINEQINTLLEQRQKTNQEIGVILRNRFLLNEEIKAEAEEE